MVVQSLFNLKSLPLLIATSATLHHMHQSDSGTSNLYVASSWNAVSDEQHRCMGLNSHGVNKVSVIDAAGVKQVEQ